MSGLLFRLLLIPITAYPQAVTPPAQPDRQLSKLKPGEMSAVSGVVRDDATGEPLRKVILQLTSVQSRGIATPIDAETDSAGKFTFTDVEPGSYHLRANRVGYLTRRYGSISTESAGSVLKLEKSQKLSDIEIKLIPHGAVVGRVVDEDGEPMPYVAIQLQRFRYMEGVKQLTPVGAYGSTNDLGEYRIFGVPPGKYYVRARVAAGLDSRSGGDEAYTPLYFPGVTDPDSAVQVDVPRGGRVQGIDFKLTRTRTYRIMGQVAAPAFPQSRPGQVHVGKLIGGTFFISSAAQWQGPQGKFVVNGVIPGSYDVVATYNEGEVRMSGQVLVNVRNQNVDIGTLSINVGPDITGAVRAEDDPQPAFHETRISLQGESGLPAFSNATATVKADGTFVIKNAPRMRAYVAVFQPPDGYYLKSARIGDADVLDEPVDLSSVSSERMNLVFSSKAAQVRGTVVDSKSKAANAASVLLIPAAEARRKHRRLWGHEQTDQTGGFMIRGIAPGEYLLVAVSDLEPGEESDPEFLKKREKSAEKIELKESADEIRQLKLAEPR